MVIGDDALNDSLPTVNSSISDTQKDDSTNQSSLEMMESIIQRLQPQDRHQNRDKIYQRGRNSGAMLIMAILLRWISVEKGADRLGDSTIPISQLGGFEFAELSLIVPSIALLATLVMSIGRERGNAVLSNLAGILVILGAFYIPVVLATLIFSFLFLFAFVNNINATPEIITNPPRKTCFGGSSVSYTHLTLPTILLV